jgi:hypothetical protein
MHNLIKRFLAICAIIMPGLAMQSPAHADGFYIGAGAYQAEVDVDDFDEDDSTMAFTLGYTLIDSNVFMFSAEISQYDLGEYSDGGIDVETDALAIAAVAYLPLGPFIEVYAKAGLADVEVEINGQDFDDDETFTGIGIGFDLFDTVDLFAEYLTFDTDADSELFGVGIRLDFF